MDGRGAWRDTIFVERLRRTIKYEEEYLRTYNSVSEACASIGRYSTSTMRDALIEAFTGKHRTRRTSNSCSQSQSQHNRGGNPLIPTPKLVQRHQANPPIRVQGETIARIPQRSPRVNQDIRPHSTMRRLRHLSCDDQQTGQRH
jgi:hypothetical protein